MLQLSLCSRLQEEEGGSVEEAGAGVAWELGSFLGAAPQLLAVQQLLIKGLFKPETELATVEACSLALHPARRLCMCSTLHPRGPVESPPRVVWAMLPPHIWSPHCMEKGRSTGRCVVGRR